MRSRFALVSSLILLSCHHDASTPPPAARACSIAAPKVDDGKLTADGTLFRDARGRVVILRGVDAGGRSKFAPFVPFDFTDATFDAALASYMDRAAAWGIDVMRVPFTWAAVEPTQGHDDEAFLKRYDALVDAAWSRGIRVVIDFHQDVYAQAFCGDGFPDWTIPDPKPSPHHDCPDWFASYGTNKDVQHAFDRFWADGSTVRAQYEALWDRIVARYKDRAGVIGFELFNEPAAGSLSNTDAFESGILTRFYSTMIARVRAAAPRSLVFFDPMGIDGLGATTKLGRPDGDGIVFAPHYYQIESFQTGPVAGDIVEDRLSRWVAQSKTWNVPLFLGEFGASHDLPEAVDYLSAHYDALDHLAMSSAQWEYSVAAEAWNAEPLGLVKADGSEYPIVAALVRPYPRAIAGESIASSFDVVKRTYTLTFAPSSRGVSEVSLPSRAFPKGYDVALEGGCFDTSRPGTLLVQSDEGAKSVNVRVTSR